MKDTRLARPPCAGIRVRLADCTLAVRVLSKRQGQKEGTSCWNPIPFKQEFPHRKTRSPERSLGA